MADDTEQPTPQEPAPRSSLAGVVVVGALVGFGALLFLANFSGQVSDPGRRTGEPFAKDDDTPRGKAKARPPKLELAPEEDLFVSGDPIDRPSAPEGARNIVVVVPTAVRRDHLEPYGAPAGRTPRLQQLASSGVRFADVVSASPFSRTAAVAWLTGDHAATLDMVEPAIGPNLRVLGPEATTFVEQLRGAGWGTYGVTANFNLNTDSGLSQGFDRFRNSQKQGFHPRARLGGAKAVELALDMLDARSDEEKARPFFLLVDIVDAHAPVRVKPDLVEKFDKTVPHAGYRAVVNQVDGAVGQLLDGLEERGHDVGTDTFFMVLGDHGEGIGTPEHHGEMHGRLLYESSVLVPWIVAGPGVPKNQVVGGIVSHTDVAPTILGMAGAPPLKGTIDGSNLTPQVLGSKPRTDREFAISDTWYFNADRASIWTSDRQCQKDFGSSGLDDAFGTGCFDRKTDPDFTNMIADDALMGKLEAWRTEASTHVTEHADAPTDPEEVEGEG